MNSKILELIEYAIKDGVITAKEREAVYKTARGYGYTPEEVDLVMDARLVEVQQSKSSSKSQTFGQRKHCPACGALVNSGQLKCIDCGYEFTGVGPNAFVRDFQNQLEYALSKAEPINDGKIKAEKQFISTYPLPTTKEDSIEMLSYLLSSIQPNNKCWRSYLNYYNAVLSRVQILGKGDKDLQLLVEDFKNASQKTQKHNLRLMAYKIVAVLIVVASIAVYFGVFHTPDVSKNSHKARKIVTKLISSNKLNKAKDLLFTVAWGYSVRDVYSALINAAIKNNEIDIAKEVTDHYVSAIDSDKEKILPPYYNYLIEVGEYDEAEKYIPELEVDLWDYLDYLKDCINNMCKQQKYTEAKQFVIRKSVYFDVQYSNENYKEYNRSNVIKELNAIIKNYENGAI